ncbi:MAG: CDP-diacylglycerol--glycerol-3-phosphate 3-phosphatidyltransferase [Xylophilus sp.]|nr:MAG: CDP-diacylglycerol--glycerol-3-phosphate 3-phosphatidyltransferase [Xylophilus sp.]
MTREYVKGGAPAAKPAAAVAHCPAIENDRPARDTIQPMFFTIPTIMTWTRIVAIPLIVGVFYAPLDPATRNLVATVLFIVFAATDWLDGFLARRLNQTSAFGAFLDPVADKFLVCASLLVLVYLRRADVFVGLTIIGREIAISALRAWMAQIGASRSVAVHMIGKLKTTVQMVAIPFLLYDGRLFGLIDTGVWGTWLIWAAAVLTVWSMVYYLRRALPEIRAKVR